MLLRLITLGLLLASLTACAGTGVNTLIILQNPETKDIRECKGDALANWNVYAATEECAKTYEKMGYVRQGQY